MKSFYSALYFVCFLRNSSRKKDFIFIFDLVHIYIVTRKNSLETHNTLLFYVFVTIISLEPSFLRAQNFKDVRFKGTFVRKLYKQSTSLLVFLEMPGDNCSIYVCTVSRRSKYKGIAIFRVPAPKTEFEKSWKDKLVAVITKEIGN